MSSRQKKERKKRPWNQISFHIKWFFGSAHHLELRFVVASQVANESFVDIPVVSYGWHNQIKLEKHKITLKRWYTPVAVRTLYRQHKLILMFIVATIRNILSISGFCSTMKQTLCCAVLFLVFLSTLVPVASRLDGYSITHTIRYETKPRIHDKDYIKW